MEQFAALLRTKDKQPIRYLVVDDSIFARKNLARMVESFGGRMAGEAGDGCTAITEYSRTQPDVVLMDIIMPQMEGIEAAEKILRLHPQARVVMVSSVGLYPGMPRDSWTQPMLFCLCLFTRYMLQFLRSRLARRSNSPSPIPRTSRTASPVIPTAV